MGFLLCEVLTFSSFPVAVSDCLSMTINASVKGIIGSEPGNTG